MSSNWWANKLGTTPAPQPQQVQPAYQPQVPLQQTQPQFQQPQQQYPPSQQIQVSARCPGCGSGNYGGASPESRPRCYDCGYPISQSGSGVGTGIIGNGGQASGPTQASKQVQPGGFNPQTIIGHI
jgi:hypothetical protein